MKTALTYCAQEVYAHDRDHFLLCLLIPAENREAFFGFYALNLELARIPALVSEEMIGHIRYAWWQEAVEGMTASGITRGHPVLIALRQEKAPGPLLLELVAAYRERYPGRMQEVNPLVDALALKLVRALAPLSEIRWTKALAMVQKHRHNYGARHTGWLVFKLLIFNI